MYHGFRIFSLQIFHTIKMRVVFIDKAMPDTAIQRAEGGDVDGGIQTDEHLL